MVSKNILSLLLFLLPLTNIFKDETNKDRVKKDKLDCNKFSIKTKLRAAVFILLICVIISVLGKVKIMNHTKKSHIMEAVKTKSSFELFI